MRISILLATLALLPAAHPAQEGGRIPVQVVAGKLVVACDLSSPSRRIPVNLWLEFDAPCGLQLHNRAVAPLKVEREDGTTIPIQVHFPDFQIEVERREHGDQDAWEQYTKYWSHEIGENSLVGVIGSQLLDDWAVTFDLAAGFVELRPPSARGAERPIEVEGGTVVPVTVENGLVWLPARHADGRPAAMAVATSRYDTLVDELVAESYGHPAGDLERLAVGGVDVTEFVALRPAEVIQVHPDGVAGVIGLNFLEHFRLEVDRVNRWASLVQTRPASFPAADRAYFAAMIAEDPEGVEFWLGEHGETRLGPEAAGLLLDLRLADLAGAETVGRAIQWVNDTEREDLRTTRLHDLMLELSDEGFPEHVVAAGEVAIESGREDRYPNAVHEVHKEMGATLLGLGEGRRAWKHLLSAAFGLPEDGKVNLCLGRYYEAEERWERAFSRYVQAAIQPESGPQAVEGLMRVQPQLPDEEPFSVDLVERLIAGKVRNFGAATRWKPDPESPPERVVLAEFFTNANLGDELAGAIGGGLAHEGLLQHFPFEHVAFLSYHLPTPQPDALVNELATYTAEVLGVTDPAVNVIDGVEWQPGAGRYRDAEAIYNRVRGAIAGHLANPTDWTLELDAEIDLETGLLSGDVAVEGPPSYGVRVMVVLAEKGVLFPGKSEVVVHRMVARGSLLDRVEGEAWNPESRRMVVPFARTVDEIAEENEAFLEELEAGGAGTIQRMSTRIDPRQARVVAFLRDEGTGEVLCAAFAEPAGLEEEAP